MTRRAAPPLGVLFITRKWPPAVGGMETYSVELTRRLARSEQIRTYALPGRSDGMAAGPGAIIAFGLRTAWRLFTGRARFGVVHGGDMAVWPLVWLAKARGLAPRPVLSAHGTDIAYATRPGLPPRLYDAYLRLGAKMLPGARIIANSQATEALTRRFGYADVVVVPLAAAGVAASGQPGPDGPYIAFVGRLIPRKGCGWFIREVLPKLPSEIRLKVAGTLGDASEAEALTEPRVDFLGPVFGDALAALRRNAVAVVVPNLMTGPESFEGFGLTAVEAAADGGVVVAARAYGLIDAVRDGVTGFLEASGDSQAWAAKLRELQSWPAQRREDFVAEARRVAATYYSWDRVALETLAAYRSDPAGDEQPGAEQTAQER